MRLTWSARQNCPRCKRQRTKLVQFWEATACILPKI
uniref:Uncharacterized protein n=1 Tax=Anguilla anguilla TaxID=7936 RepID=A0A0E9TP71_ANGAN